MGFSPSVVKLDVNFEFSSQLSKLSTGDATGPVTCACFIPFFLEGSVSEKHKEKMKRMGDAVNYRISP